MDPDEPIETLLRRLAAVGTDADHTRFRSHSVLMKEHLRRAAMWADALGLPEYEEPFADLAALVAPEFRVSEEALTRLPEMPTPEMRAAAEAMLHWSAAADRREVRRFELPDPFEPLLRLFERGGHFWVEDGLIRIGIVGMAMRTWRLRSKFPPSATDDGFLDALDANGLGPI